MAVAGDIKSYVHAVGLRDPGIDFVLQPVLGNFALHGLNIPGESVAEIASAARKSESTLGAACAEHGVRSADGAALTVGNLIRFLGLGFGLAFCGTRHRLGLDLRLR